MKINEVLTKRPPSILYHYTSQEGLLGILDNRELWATKAHYLNDSKEFSYAIDLLNEVLSEEEYDQEETQALRDAIGSVEQINVCVSSFTKNGNLLSQWRGYGSEGAGYSLGINGKQLNRIAESQNFILVPVLYRRDQQLLLIKELIELWLNDQHEIDGLTPVTDSEAEFEDYFSMIAPIFKDASFEEEEEWRIISPILSCEDKKFGFRPGKYSLLPYYRFSLEVPENKFTPSKIIIGPSPMQNLSKHALDLYLMSKGFKREIELSEIPYRGW